MSFVKLVLGMVAQFAVVLAGTILMFFVYSLFYRKKQSRRRGAGKKVSRGLPPQLKFSVLLLLATVVGFAPVRDKVFAFFLERSGAYSAYTEGVAFHEGYTDVVYYNQEAAPWGEDTYGTDLIAETGCGPTSLAMAVSTLTTTPKNPKELCDWAEEAGYWCPGSGSYHTVVRGGAEAFGLSCDSLTGGQEVADALADGKLVIALMGPGTFTQSGHFVLLHGITEKGMVSLADSKSKERSKKKWELGQILAEAKAGAGDGGPFWAIY